MCAAPISGACTDNCFPSSTARHAHYQGRPRHCQACPVGGTAGCNSHGRVEVCMSAKTPLLA